MTGGLNRVAAAASVGLAGLLVASAAVATPMPRFETLVAQHAPEPSPPTLALPLSAPPFKSTKVLAIDTTLTLNPTTGELTGHADIAVESLGSVAQLWVLIDGGLTINSATSATASVTVAAQPYSGYTYASLSIAPALAAGEKLTIALSYAGKLVCAAQNCKVGPPLAYLLEGSAVPSLVDQDSIGGLNAWGASRSLELHLPLGTDAVASGELVTESKSATETITQWKIPGFHSYGGNVVMMGALSSQSVSGASPATSVWALGSAPSYVPEMGDWMQKILPFLDAQAGKPLPYPGLSVFKLPLGWTDIFRGTAGFGLTLLSEDYANSGAGYFEETLAHENAHQWWGVLVSPTDILYTRWLVEGLATLSQIDYAAEHQNPGLSRDEYLTRRYREHWNLVRYLGDPTLPLVVQSTKSIPQDPIENTLWAYIRSSAFLEHLRVVVGDAVFAQTLQQWASQCAQKFCDTADFLALIEKTSGRDFDAAFSQSVYSGVALEPRISFAQAAADQVTVTALGIDGLSLPLELWVELETGQREIKAVTFEGSTPVPLSVGGPVRSVRPNPRHDGLVWSRSSVTGDMDFDGEVDGIDVIHCAFRLGKVAAPNQPGGEGIWRSDLDFDSRCDADGNGSIDEADLAVVTGAFGTLMGGN